jgi:hypothetical protein
VGASVVGALAATGLHAQDAMATQQQTLLRMQQAPMDHENTFAYVQASAEAHDFEASIAALERTLLYNPKLTRAKVELGMLYFRLGSFNMAVVYFDDALADPDLEPALRARIEGFLPDARKQLSASRFSGVFQTGVRYDSNVAGAPDTNFLRSFGLDVLVRPIYTPKADGNGFALGEVDHVYDFQNQRGDLWESRFAGYGTLQFQQSDLNVGLFEFATGPRLAVAPELFPGLTVRPYLGAAAAAIAGSDYINTYGGGVSLGIPWNASFSIEPGFDVRRVEVTQIALVTNQGDLSSGSLWTGSLFGSWQIADNIKFDGKLFYRVNLADPGGFDSDQFGAEGAIRFNFAPPSDLIGVDWSATPFVRYLAVLFRQPDPVVDPLIRRRDNEWRAGLQLDMPVTPTFGVNSVIQTTRYDSNIVNFRSSSWSVLAGPTIRF